MILHSTAIGIVYPFHADVFYDGDCVVDFTLNYPEMIKMMKQ